MTEPDYSKRDYNKKIYWDADPKDLRKSFSKKINRFFRKNRSK